MQEASPETVLGDFSDAMLEHRGERFRFRRRGNRFLVETAGADGEPGEFEIAYTFGVAPLQQHLVRLPGGRLQALGVAWDTRPAARGGQRWFHLLPDETVPPGDVLHWTGPAGGWNAMCADCHSTNVIRGYRLGQDRYETTWSEIDVACEACHGPGSAHVEGGELPVRLGAERSWRFAEGAAIAHRVPAGRSGEIEACAPCHSRRTRIGPEAPGQPFLDAYHPALLEDELYFADGQIREEVYVWGSFVQSRMYAAGVTCSDCHDPHGLAIEEPDAVCSGCHRPAVFATTGHHRHAAGSEGASCVACHMPSRTYMVVDARRDHGFRVPRPDLGVALGVPDACTGCHEDRSPAWAAEAVAGWTGREPQPHAAEAVHAGRRRTPGAAKALAALADDDGRSAMVRATALRLLGDQLDARSVASLHAGLRSREPLVRMAAAGAAAGLPPAERWLALEPLLRDASRAVRVQAAGGLAPLRAGVTDPRALEPLDAALEEYRAAQWLAPDRPESHVNLGLLHQRLGETDPARRAFETALRVGPWFVPAYLALAELERSAGRDDEGERLLRGALTRSPNHADALHALGLLQVRDDRHEEALTSLARAAEGAPDNPRYAYAHGLALHATGDLPGALDLLARAHERHPGDIDLLVSLVTFHRDAGQPEAARRYARKLHALHPDHPAAAQ